MKKYFLLVLSLIITAFPAFSQTVSLIPSGSTWKYLDNGSNQGTGWRALAFNDASWNTGNAQLGYGDGDEAKVVSYGPNANYKYITTYFRKTIVVSNPATYNTLKVYVKRDDGAVVYLNGTEIARSNISSGTVSYTKLASLLISGSGESTFYSYNVNKSLLLTGNNTIAVEVHQYNGSSPDLSFDLKLEATLAATCSMPGSLSSTGITTNSANLGWSAVSGATGYNIQFRPVGSPAWTTTTSSTNSKAITSLSPATVYEWQVQTVCTAGTSTYTASSNFTTASGCGVPSGLNATGITAGGATLNWAAVSGALNYNIQFRPVGTTTWTLASSTGNTTTLSSLNAGTLYEWMVHAVCNGGPGTFSGLSNFSTPGAGTDTLVYTNSAWKYLDNGSNQGTAWQAPGFNDGSWASGNAELGYGDGGEATVVGYGGNSNVKYITTYFRKSFNVSNPLAYVLLRMNVVRDDGIIVYLNGAEVYRNNLPSGTVTYTTLAPAAIGNADESAWTSVTLNPASLVAGNNTIAVEIHQQAVTSTDISFNLRLYASGQMPPPVLLRGPYLQKLSPNSIHIRWRTDVASDSRVLYGPTTSYGGSVTDAASTTEHIINLTGLSPGSKYYYSIGTTAYLLQGDTNNNFITAPVTGTVAPVRIWVTGDFGNGSTSQDNVRNAYMNYPGAHATNLWLWLGDNAYATGTDAEYQSNVFNHYPAQLKKFPLYPSPGNHDYGNAGYQNSTTLGTNFPYFNIFSVPQSAESGGVASNTPKYYSYNYGNIHFISLDSYGSYNSTSSPMYQWLVADLAANTQRWIIAYWHHPPYTKGTHNSDTDTELINMRTNIIPLLESYHTDLVLCGHSHVNERSYLIKGHYGLSNTFNASMKISTATNVFSKSLPYDGTVYATCGTSGQNPGGLQSGAPMPCMYFTNNINNCSMVIDVNGDVLSAKYLTSSGTIADQFTITKSVMKDALPVIKNGTEAWYNAAENMIFLNYHLNHDAPVKVELVSLLGTVIHEFKDIPSYQSAGFYWQELSLNGVTAQDGIYLLRLTVNDKTEVKKLLLAR